MFLCVCVPRQMTPMMARKWGKRDGLEQQCRPIISSQNLKLNTRLSDQVLGSNTTRSPESKRSSWTLIEVLSNLSVGKKIHYTLHQWFLWELSQAAKPPTRIWINLNQLKHISCVLSEADCVGFRENSLAVDGIYIANGWAESNISHLSSSALHTLQWARLPLHDTTHC